MVDQTKKYNIGLALSGGGVRGLAHLGVLKALNEKRIKIDILSGTSAGALAAAFYADGYSPDEIYELFSSKKIYELIRITFPRLGLFKVSGIREILNNNLRTKFIEDLKIPIRIAVTNFYEGKIEYRSKGDLAEALIASSSIPILFEIAEIDKIPYIDGGFMDNLPIAPIRQDCKICIAVHVNPLSKQAIAKNLFQIAERAFHLALVSDIENKKSKIDLFIEPVELIKHGLLDMKKSDEIFKIGYDEAMRVIESQKDISLYNL